VTADIQGDHLIPVIWNRRLYIFWPNFTQKAQQAQSASSGSDPNGQTPLTKESLGALLKSQTQEPQKYWEISLAWSEYKQGKWSSKQVAKQVLQLLDNTSYPRSVFDDPNDKSHIYTNYKYVFKTDKGDQNGDAYLSIKCEICSRTEPASEFPQDLRKVQ
jgi:hypothetical protein